MPKTRSEKKEIVTRLAEQFRKMKAAAFSSISGFDMAQASSLRAKASESGAKIFVAKKTLLDLATKEAGLTGLDPKALEGSILTAISFDDEVTAAKLLKGLSKENENVNLIAGFLEGKALSQEEVLQLAALPGKQELLAKLVGSLNAPVSGFVNVLAGNLRGFVRVLSAIKDQKS